MDTVVYTLSPDASVHDAVAFLLDKRVTGAPVIDRDQHVVGIITEKDCLRLLAIGDGEGIPDGKVSDFMSTNIVSVSPNMNIYFVAGMFLRDVVRRFPVIDNGRLVGAITRFDILRAIQKAYGQTP
jgi:CBS domain-containing protein